MDLCFIFTFISFCEAFLGLDLYFWLMKVRKRMKKKWKTQILVLVIIFVMLNGLSKWEENKGNERKSRSKLKEARAKNKKKWKKKENIEKIQKYLLFGWKRISLGEELLCDLLLEFFIWKLVVYWVWIEEWSTLLHF